MYTNVAIAAIALNSNQLKVDPAIPIVEVRKVSSNYFSFFSFILHLQDSHCTKSL